MFQYKMEKGKDNFVPEKIRPFSHINLRVFGTHFHLRQGFTESYIQNLLIDSLTGLLSLNSPGRQHLWDPLFELHLFDMTPAGLDLWISGWVAFHGFPDGLHFMDLGMGCIYKDLRMSCIKLVFGGNSFLGSWMVVYLQDLRVSSQNLTPSFSG